MAHADWLLRGPGKSPPGTVRGQYAFFRTGKLWRENFRIDLNKNKKGLGMFLWKFEQ